MLTFETNAVQGAAAIVEKLVVSLARGKTWTRAPRPLTFYVEPPLYEGDPQSGDNRCSTSKP